MLVQLAKLSNTYLVSSAESSIFLYIKFTRIWMHLFYNVGYHYHIVYV